MSETISVRRLVPGDADYLRAIHMAVGVEAADTPGGVNPEVESILETDAAGGPTVDLVYGVWLDGALETACLALRSPGRAALVMIPTDAPPEPLGRALAVQRRAAWEDDLRLLEVLILPRRDGARRALRAADYRHLTTLVYMRARPRPEPERAGHEALSWVSYVPDRAALFERAVARSYEQSLDCPELSALRTPADAIAGHRATGVFDPKLWWVALREGEPQGVILLSRLADSQVLELVYMGTSVGARGAGVGQALLDRCFRCARHLGVRSVALAVDARNLPARRLYERRGFVEIGVRDAWISSPD
jgi:ribosomal protein S18 acetylase RimI-like enzyme